jgi:hypothetical protein
LKSLPGRIVLHRLHRGWSSGQAGLERCAYRHQIKPHPVAWMLDGYVYMVIGLSRNHHRALDAVLSAGFDRGKGSDRRQFKASQARASSPAASCTDVVAWFIIVACAATLYANGYHNVTAAKMPQALRPLAGDFAYIPFRDGPFQCIAICRIDSAPFHRLYRFEASASNPAWG